MGFGSILSKASAALEKSQNKGATTTTTTNSNTTTTTPAATSSGNKIDVAQAAGLAKTIFGSKSHGSHGHNTTQAKVIDAAADYISKNGSQQQQQQQPANGQPPNTTAQPATSSGNKIDVAQAAGLAKTIFGSKSHGGHSSNSTQAKVIGAAADYISKNGSQQQQQQQPANGQPPNTTAQPATSSGKIDVGKLGKLAGKFLNKGH
ncbi:hypothetical protein GGH93_005926 [Coemansia aciculifera]|nr:hypothetical protein GGH93_005926 [Coemansia aciculifera]